jgi:AcrR family transcriptional regulator
MPGGRRAGPTRTRQDILDAARVQFVAWGYDAVSLRAIARHAGVDPALVHHFFNSKLELFAAARELPVDPEPFIAALLAGERDTLGERLVLALVELWDRPDGFHGFLALLRGAVSHADAARLLRELRHRRDPRPTRDRRCTRRPPNPGLRSPARKSSASSWARKIGLHRADRHRRPRLARRHDRPDHPALPTAVLPPTGNEEAVVAGAVVL